MSTARLVLKQPTGWFAAGREVAQALHVLSDGAFKLYIHLCLEADRHTGRAVIEPAVLTQVLRKDPVSIEASLGELHLNKVCARRGNRVEICDRFWPYQKVGTGAADPEADFVRQVREAFLKPACVRSAFTAADEKLVLNLCRRGVGLEQVRRAIWLGCVYTSVFVADVIFNIADKRQWITKLKMQRLIGHTNIDFMGWFPVCLTGWILITVMAIGVSIYRGQGLFDIDFTGGTMVQALFNKPKIPARFVDAWGSPARSGRQRRPHRE